MRRLADRDDGVVVFTQEHELTLAGDLPVAHPGGRDWRAYFASKEFDGPLWVTATGYPADPAFQTVAGYQDRTNLTSAMDDHGHPQYTRRPSFYAVRQLARRTWPERLHA